MDGAPQSLRAEIRRLLTHQAGGSEQSIDLFEALENACDQLRQTLGLAIGIAGYDALFARGLRFARKEYPFLQEMEAGPHNCIDAKDLLRVAEQRDEEEVVLAGLAILANVVWTLSTMIGVDLTIGHFGLIKPDFSFDKATFRDSKTTLPQSRSKFSRVISFKTSTNISATSRSTVG